MSNENAALSNNSFDLERTLLYAMQTPGIKVDREKFLKKELSKYYLEDTVEKAVIFNPARAGVQRHYVDILAGQAIEYESKMAMAVSFAASFPGGPAAIGAAAADATSFFVYILRVVQKLAYLYGFEEFELNAESIDSGTMDHIIVFIGVMFGTQGASVALRKIADAFANRMSKTLAKKALTKGMLYPIVKKISNEIGFKMTKQIFADGVASIVPFVSGVLSGGLTYAAFKPRCIKLKNELARYPLSDPQFYRSSYTSNTT